jgi:hypothetical protein
MKRALLVGINAYPGQPLHGCVNDVTDMADYLVHAQGFQTGDIRLLVDTRATAQGIRDRLQWLITGAKAGDTLYFHYSGHGAQFPIRDAAGTVVSNHGTLCPVDFDFTPQRALLDSDLRAIMNKVAKGVEFIFVADSCFSGDLMRAFHMFRARVFQPPADIAWRTRTANANNLAFRGFAVHDACGFISGCAFDQESADANINGRFNGALTYYLLQSLQAAHGNTLPLTTLIANLNTAIHTAGYAQNPQLKGPDAIVAKAFLK